ncbi:MAG TPA: ATP phosphoribosyltransferase regulatory subunit, partial [Caulobacteraceae bacterium]|nr:ATP phosphoribosyltransferase regulatory subunit [Caulobacteraceae bacterium]
SSLRPERQFGQAGVELIGAAAARADAEVILLAAEALEAVGVEGLSIDLNLPSLVPILAGGLGLAPGAAESLVDALDRRDAGAVKQLAGREAMTFGALLAAAGPARKAMPALAKLVLPKTAMAERERLGEVVDLVLRARPKLVLTVDPAEHRGLEYHSGVGFTFFARRSRAELGRGGRYVSGKGEPSTGFTLYMDGLLRALPAPAKYRRLFIPADAPASHARRWRAKGWITVTGLDPAAEAKAEARRLGCSHVMGAGRAIALRG